MEATARPADDEVVDEMILIIPAADLAAERILDELANDVPPRPATAFERGLAWFRGRCVAPSAANRPGAQQPPPAEPPRDFGSPLGLDLQRQAEMLREAGF
jgi:hypothetical protein